MEKRGLLYIILTQIATNVISNIVGYPFFLEMQLMYLTMFSILTFDSLFRFHDILMIMFFLSHSIKLIL